MKKRLILILLLLIVVSINQITAAKMVTKYQQQEEIPIYTRTGRQTTIQFESPIETLTTGNDNNYTVKEVTQNQITIYAKKEGAETNLNVTTKDKAVYVFDLVETDEKEYYSFVQAKNKPNLDIAHYINLANKKRVSISPAVRELTNIYNIEENVYSIKGLDLNNGQASLRLSAKRAVTVKGDNVSIYWFRLQNSGKREVNINLHSINVESRAVLGRALEEKKEQLSQGEYVDIYLILEGAYTEPKLTLTMLINDEFGRFRLKNIPYTSQEFKVFVSDGDSYKSVTIEDYQR